MEVSTIFFYAFFTVWGLALAIERPMAALGISAIISYGYYVDSIHLQTLGECGTMYYILMFIWVALSHGHRGVHKY